jgi:hypothetical protein
MAFSATASGAYGELFMAVFNVKMGNVYDVLVYSKGLCTHHSPHFRSLIRKRWGGINRFRLRIRFKRVGAF